MIMMTMTDALIMLALCVLIGGFIWHCPIFKPYWGFRRPRDRARGN